MKYPIKVFKFGGASVRHADAVRKVSNILKNYHDEKILVVVSAMGKTTNALERVVAAFLAGKDFQAELRPLRQYHKEVMQELFAKGHPVYEKVNMEFEEVESSLKNSLASF